MLSALTAGAQATGNAAAPWLAQFARQERERRVQESTVGRVYTTEDVRRGLTPPPPAPRPAAAPAKPAAAEAAKPASAPAKEKDWATRLAEQRAKVRELTDRQTALELQVSQFTNQFLAPVTDANAQQTALARLTEAQTKLDDTKKELNEAQSKLRELEGTSQK
ncbi:MAG TPA: hypothetical protein VFY29_10325 [Terriglobia bacterium]|nr:hypothetical protein [Terriglobia bacterium]